MSTHPCPGRNHLGEPCHHVLAQSDTPAAILLVRPCLACNRETGERMCDLCTRLELAEARAEP